MSADPVEQFRPYEPKDIGIEGVALSWGTRVPRPRGDDPGLGQRLSMGHLWTDDVA